MIKLMLEMIVDLRDDVVDEKIGIKEIVTLCIVVVAYLYLLIYPYF